MFVCYVYYIRTHTLQNMYDIIIIEWEQIGSQNYMIEHNRRITYTYINSLWLLCDMKNSEIRNMAENITMCWMREHVKKPNENFLNRLPKMVIKKNE